MLADEIVNDEIRGARDATVPSDLIELSAGGLIELNVGDSQVLFKMINR